MVMRTKRSDEWVDAAVDDGMGRADDNNDKTRQRGRGMLNLFSVGTIKSANESRYEKTSALVRASTHAIATTADACFQPVQAHMHWTDAAGIGLMQPVLD